MQENVKYMQDQCDDLEGKDDEQSKTTLAQLVKDIDEREKNLKEVNTVAACFIIRPSAYQHASVPSAKQLEGYKGTEATHIS